MSFRFIVNDDLWINYRSIIRSSCPDRPEPCGWEAYRSPKPNPQLLYGAVVSGPDENDNYKDLREEYIYNEVTLDYNAGFQSAVAGLRQLELIGGRKAQGPFVKNWPGVFASNSTDVWPARPRRTNDLLDESARDICLFIFCFCSDTFSSNQRDAELTAESAVRAYGGVSSFDRDEFREPKIKKTTKKLKNGVAFTRVFCGRRNRIRLRTHSR